MKKLTKIIVVALVLVMLFGTVYSSAFEPYDTYTYSIDGEAMKSPAAYSADDVYTNLDMGIDKLDPAKPNLNTAKDIFADDAGNIYIADTGNDRIVVLDKYFKAKAIISTYIDEYGKLQSLKGPQGLYVTSEAKNETEDKSSYIYVCDTDNLQIVVFDRQYNYVRTIKKPDSSLLNESSFKPCAIAVDIYGRIFITSSASYEGVIVMSSEGDFTGFIGAQKVTYSLIEMIWRRFQSKEQREAAVKKLAIPYNNITVNDKGFVYVTSNSTDPDDMKSQYGAIKSKSAGYSPVKKLNSKGDEIMSRNGFFDPGGEVDVESKDVSQIIDVAVGPEGTWTLLDQSRSRFFTYDGDGNLLFAFGEGAKRSDGAATEGADQLGNGEQFVGMTYQVIDGVYHLVALDNSGAGYRVTVYSPTPYYDTIINALRNQNLYNYAESIECWQEVLTKNNNFDLAYIGIGKALLNQGKYEEAQEMLSKAYETDSYSKAFNEIRKNIISKWMLPLIIGIIVLVVLVLKFFGYAKKKNKAVSLKVGKKSYWEELLFSFHLVFHPFDGFWDLKHEKRGSVRASLTIMGLTVLAFFYQAIGQGYTFNPRGDYSTIFIQVLAVIVPVALWCVSNWCLTTLFDGEGSFKDIVVATGYALAPLPVFVIASTILTNVLTASEGSMVSLLVTLGYVWVGILLFFGMLVTHDYSMNKSIATTLGTILAMVVIMFIIILFFSLVAKMLTFIIAIFSEIGNRL